MGAPGHATLLRLVRAARPAVVSIFPRSDPPVLVLTDASEISFRKGAIGVVVWCPASRNLYYCAMHVPLEVLLYFAWLAAKNKYICQLELLAVSAAYYTFPDILRGRLVHHFVDNRAAMSNMISGYSSKPDSAVLIGTSQEQILNLQCYPWFGFVCSEDNLSDLPSRHEFRLLRELKAKRRACRLPPLKGRPGFPL